ncbi:nucleotidyltransferase family protein [Pseudomonas sp. RIT-PI-AD]|uniref:nucleotidyltransferase family protein n=1 Tax=Pseudomonas sp. RIT-PI-AD TaxID=3035294 RepID=UPI0021D89EFA|nr:nucleotidyltransferase family protein [Pseudomonas sp. RIT-PI-AD]
MLPDTDVIALILAAGRGRRFGRDKRLARLPDGTPLLAASLAQARRCFAEVAVVLREDDDAQALGIPAEVRVIRCAEADLGMGHSLAAGARALRERPARALAVLLGDMPWIAEGSLRRLACAAEATHILFPRYRGERGHPVLFGRLFWGALETLEGDRGARELLQERPECCVAIDLDDPGVLRDVDSEAALAPETS